MDGRHLRESARRGVSRYTRLLLGELAEEFPGDEWVAVAPGARELPAGAELRAGGLPRRPLFGAAALAGRPRLDRLARGCDVAWLPAPAPVALSRAVPLVLTVHDLSFEHRPADYGRYERAWHRLARPRELARRATRVIAVSDAVRADLLEEWGLPPQRVVTVRSGPGSPPAPPGCETPGVRPSLLSPARPFFLAAGALEPRKQPLVLAEAHRLARADGLESELVFAGEGPLAAALERAGATVLGRVSDTDLDLLYREALALACVSREEGFGLTPLEAAARGTPAVVCDLPVFAETLGSAALRVPSGDPRALADALLRLEREPALRDRLATAAAAAAARLSWTRAAHETHAVLAAAAAERPA
jgi:glycosyltransferase involved in cell wall biosynthesis